MAEPIEIDDSVRILAAQAYVEDIQKYRGLIEKSNETIDYLKRKVYSIGGYNVRETKVQAPKGEKGAAYEGYLMKLEKAKESHEKNYCFWKSKTLSPLISIGKINNLNFQYLLRLRYSSCKAWKEIETGLQCDNVHAVRDQALLALSQVMEQEGRLQKYVETLFLKGSGQNER